MTRQKLAVAPANGCAVENTRGYTAPCASHLARDESGPSRRRRLPKLFDINFDFINVDFNVDFC
jgi:hypothetical protein